jgi:hypothetical protein
VKGETTTLDLQKRQAQKEGRIMEGVPGGLLSFLYHVTYDLEFNKQFNQDEEETMDFFQVPLRVRQVIREISKGERKKSDNLKTLRNQAKAKGTRAIVDKLAVEEEKFVKREVVPPDAMDVVLSALKEELNDGVYRRFW